MKKNAASGAPKFDSKKILIIGGAVLALILVGVLGKKFLGSKKFSPQAGLEVEVLQSADGQEIKKGQLARVHYTGWLENGTKFDSSLDRNEPFEFRVGEAQVIKGWDAGVVGMKVGEKRKLKIASDLGYGPLGAGTIIPPNSTLIFEVELLAISE